MQPVSLGNPNGLSGARSQDTPRDTRCGPLASTRGRGEGRGDEMALPNPMAAPLTGVNEYGTKL